MLKKLVLSLVSLLVALLAAELLIQEGCQAFPRRRQLPPYRPRPPLRG